MRAPLFDVQARSRARAARGWSIHRLRGRAASARVDLARGPSPRRRLSRRKLSLGAWKASSARANPRQHRGDAALGQLGQHRQRAAQADERHLVAGGALDRLGRQPERRVTGVEQRGVGQRHLHRDLRARRAPPSGASTRGPPRPRPPTAPAPGAGSRGRAPPTGTIVRGSPTQILFTSSAVVGAGALVELLGRAARPSARPPTHAITSAPAGSRFHESRSASVGRRDAGAQLRAGRSARRRPGSTARSIREQHVGGVHHGAAVARPSAGRARRCAPPRDAEIKPARGRGDRRGALVDHQRVEHHRAVGLAAVARRIQRMAEREPTSSSPSTRKRTFTGSSLGPGQLAGHVEQRQEVALVVGGAARVEAAVALGRARRAGCPIGRADRGAWTSWWP